MKIIIMNKVNEVMSHLTLNETTKVTSKITKETYTGDDNFTYDFFYFEDKLCKIEVYNHRELNELYIKENIGACKF